MSIITAKEALEGTKARAQKVKEQKLKLVDSRIRMAIDEEMFDTKFTFAELKPFVGVIVEALTELEYTVSQTGTFILVSWAPKKIESVKIELKKPTVIINNEIEYGNEADDDEEFEDDDNDIWNS